MNANSKILIEVGVDINRSSLLLCMHFYVVHNLQSFLLMYVKLKMQISL